MTKIKRTFSLESEYDLQKVANFIEDNTSAKIIDGEAHYNDTWIYVEGTDADFNKINDYFDTL